MQRTELVEGLMGRFPHVPREAVIKEDLLRGGLAFDDSALTDNEHGDVKPKSYFIFCCPTASRSWRSPRRSSGAISST
ncbi:hypothetical protein GCM10010435_73270 [Winogradskya consettensis]|uniref:Uncharacterized protein n=1 Tax=Winogradskya consettensis TaxID=113560 RepID=A0A919SLX8_9ACTN|nr:hypothetical protein [Actinoplanes consettensis]GIM75225.1 hypothetical protein Aco04nite_44310 [Actinoplanes consettensis]